MDDEMKMKKLISGIYGDDESTGIEKKINRIIEKYKKILPRDTDTKSEKITEKDAMLITYGDQIRSSDNTDKKGVPPLKALGEFTEKHLSGVVSSIHILPFYPYTSDDGFSVIDYREVNPDLGNWDNVKNLSYKFKLMFDAVINHISSRSGWFERFLAGDKRYESYFITPGLDFDFSHVVRPRTSSVLTDFKTADGVKSVWTTFSADQVDLNYGNPDVLCEAIDLLLYYALQGADFIRLDAIGFLWKESGKTCINLPEAHNAVKLFRHVIDMTAPHVKIITETNVPHKDNISYFGDGTDEAHLVYNFALPPLVMHTLQSGDSSKLSGWASGLELPSGNATFFNFLASHDGVGINPARGILSDEEIEMMINKIIKHGGLVSYKNNSDGTSIPYEMNINYFDALSDPASEEPIEIQVDRFITAHAIMFSLTGLPGIYFHSIFGSRSWKEGVKLTGHNRTINRQKFTLGEIKNELNDRTNLRHVVFMRMKRLLEARSGNPAFSPYVLHEIIDAGHGIFALKRGNGNDKVLCLHNISDKEQIVRSGLFPEKKEYHDMAKDKEIMTGSDGNITMEPYSVLWLV